VTTATDVAALDAYRCLMHRDRAVRRALATAPIPAAAASSHLCARCELPLLTLAEADGAAALRVCVGSDGRATHWACAEQHERRSAQVFICRGDDAAQRARRRVQRRGKAGVEGGPSVSSNQSRLQLLKQIDRGDGVDIVMARLHA
jgi:hypothetical protein